MVPNDPEGMLLSKLQVEIRTPTPPTLKDTGRKSKTPRTMQETEVTHCSFPMESKDKKLFISSGKAPS